MPFPLLRPLHPEDIGAVLCIQARCYFQMEPESAAALLSRLRLSPDTCWLAQSEGAAAGYLLAHPWRSDAPPALDTELERLPAEADCFYLHDLAIDPDRRGRGIAELLVEAALAAASGLSLRRCALTAVQSSQPFWARFGFRPAPAETAAEKLASYGGDAVLMWREMN
jgi:GNAT superfamily N-acetyltransferase